ncbi:superoxide dismutase [Ereboglobus luteus]|uniref:Superoxide dismutase n=1 Tax=Ereboglobus luteus TaxID=1796921 RepID=A0A2U8E451_9BACT|nr:superoxide dismutase [Ereboglobus luteus]AWI09580.1 hypothetical protein CKA38_10295 [Ereboglobus luteus]
MNKQPSRITRRAAIKTLGVSASLLGLKLFSPELGAAPSGSSAPKSGVTYPFALPPLGFDYAALEPHIDARTMEIHHGKHHQAYVTNANNALASHPALQKLDIAELLSRINGGAIDEPLRTALRNNVGGHANHAFFWRILAPRAKGSAPASGENALRLAIETTFGGLAAFKAQFADAAMKRFGSGWAWLVVSRETGRLAITTSANQDSPLLSGDVPVLGLDVWEHAYYLKYQNRRADYIAAFWNVVNWSRCGEFYAAGRP